uniref:MAPK kinase substrate protein n=1 Tax=Vitis vinifera TaxID=29760 RepID=A5BHH7_VITVI|nr:hypothetical protein VITISV_011678 [Vitis vinifera]
MAGLQRSEISFRRQGSSGSVWDDKFLAGALNQAKQNDQEEEQKAEAGEAKLSQSPAPISVMERSRSNGGQAYKTVKVAPAIDPPSPRVSGCGLCGVFGKPVKSHHRPKRGFTDDQNCKIGKRAQRPKQPQKLGLPLAAIHLDESCSYHIRVKI